MTHDDDRDRIQLPKDEATDEQSGGFPPMPPLDAVDPDLAQEGEAADPPDSGWAGAAREAQGETPSREEGGSSRA